MKYHAHLIAPQPMKRGGKKIFRTHSAVIRKSWEDGEETKTVAQSDDRGLMWAITRAIDLAGETVAQEIYEKLTGNHFDDLSMVSAIITEQRNIFHSAAYCRIYTVADFKNLYRESGSDIPAIDWIKNYITEHNLSRRFDFNYALRIRSIADWGR